MIPANLGGGHGLEISQSQHSLERVVVMFAVVLAGASYYLYPDKNLFLHQFAELLLQLVLLVVVGTLPKEVVDWAVAAQARLQKMRNNQLDFMRRVRAMHL